ncbi:unannotated protein [freshwater metagenome]|uniref:Unannotated protein n=1 Tax=freshwater metagenome TaxID=449393 RepID=A0A6J6U3C3_9ZZZZ
MRVGELAGEPVEHHAGDGDREEQEPGITHAVAPHFLSEAREAEEHRKERRAEHDRRDVGEPERPEAKQLEVEHWTRVACRAPDQVGAEERTDQDAADCPRVRPPPTPALGNAEDDPRDRSHDERHAPQVGEGSILAGHLRDEQVHQDDADEGERRVDPERPTPATLVYEHGTEGRADRGRHRSRCGPCGDRSRSTGRGELAEHERRTGRCEQCAEQRLEDAHREEEPDRP